MNYVEQLHVHESETLHAAGARLCLAAIHQQGVAVQGRRSFASAPCSAYVNGKFVWLYAVFNPEKNQFWWTASVGLHVSVVTGPFEQELALLERQAMAVIEAALQKAGVSSNR